MEWFHSLLFEDGIAHTILLYALVISAGVALGYAVAYPLGVTGIILSLMLIRLVFRIDLKKENQRIKDTNDPQSEKIEFLTIRLLNKHLDGRKLHDVKRLVGRSLIVSRMMRRGDYSVPVGNTVLKQGDISL